MLEIEDLESIRKQAEKLANATKNAEVKTAIESVIDLIVKQPNYVPF
jgi:hypothetical protein